MNLIFAVLLNTLFLLIGFMISISIGMKRRWEIFGASYLLGTGFITVIFLLVEQYLNFQLDVKNLLFSTLFLITASIFALIFSRKKIDLNYFNIVKDFKKLLNLKQPKKAIAITVLCLIIFTLWENYFWPITSWDSLALYDFRAKVIVETGSMVDGIKLGYFFQYPPYTSFLHAYSYMLNIGQSKVAYSFIYFSLVVSFYSLVRRKKSQLVSLLAMLFIATDTFIFRHATTAYTNLAYISYLSLGLLYLSFWIESGKRSDLIIGFLLSGFSTWVRPAEPFWLVSVILGAVGIFKHRKFVSTYLVSLIFLSLIKNLWDQYTANLYLMNSVPAQTLSERRLEVVTNLITNYQQTFSIFFSKIFEVIKYYVENFYVVAKSVLPLIILALFIDIKSRNKNNLIFYLTAFACISLLFAGIIFLSLFYDTWNQIADSLQRVIMTIIPILIFIIFNSKLFDEN